MVSSVFFEANQVCGFPQPCCLESGEAGPCLKGVLESLGLRRGFEAIFKAGRVLVRSLRDVPRLELALWPPGWSQGPLREEPGMARTWAASSVTPPPPTLAVQIWKRY